jgi:FixJ family two-component response regulator
MMRNQKVYVVDDDRSVRDALTTLLDVSGIPSAAYASGEEFLADVDDRWSGCVLLDLRMGGMTGLEVQHALSCRVIEMPIVMITAHGDVATVRAALKAGAHDFLEKPVDHQMLLQVVRRSLSLDEQRVHVATQLDEVRRKLARLSTREKEVMKHLILGHQHREIAADLGISPRTVEVYKARMMEKLGARSLADLIRLGAHLEPS